MFKRDLWSARAAHHFLRIARQGAAALSAAAAALTLLGLAPARVQAQYTAQFLPPPSQGQPAGTVSPIALNNRGQVLLANSWNGPAPNRGLALYADGATVALNFPAGYHWADIGVVNFLNDTGIAMTTGQLDSASGTNGGLRPLVWRDGTASALPLPMTPEACGIRYSNLAPPFTQETFNVFPVGLNRSGHVLVYACNSLWIMDTAGNILLAGPPPADLPPIGLQPVFYEELFGNHLNDADIASAETGAPGFAQGTHPGVLRGLSTFAPLAVDFGYALAINNRNQVLAFVQLAGGSTADCLLASGSALADLGSCALASLNGLGQVAFLTATFQGQPRLYKDGAVQPITLPPEVSGMVFTGGSKGLNDAGQIIGFDLLSRAVLLTPSGACAADVSGQTTVRHGALRFDAATGHYMATVRVKNNGTTTLAAPLSVVLDGLPATASLVNTSGATSCATPAGSFFVDLPGSLAPGRLATGTLEFIVPSGARLRFGTRVIAGPGRR